MSLSPTPSAKQGHILNPFHFLVYKPLASERRSFGLEKRGKGERGGGNKAVATSHNNRKGLMRQRGFVLCSNLSLSLRTFQFRLYQWVKGKWQKSVNLIS